MGDKITKNTYHVLMALIAVGILALLAKPEQLYFKFGSIEFCGTVGSAILMGTVIILVNRGKRKIEF